MRSTTNNPLIGARQEKMQVMSGVKTATKLGITIKTIIGLMIFVGTIIATLSNQFLWDLSTNPFFAIGSLIIYFIGIFRMRKNMVWAKRLFFFYPIIQGIIMASTIYYVELIYPGIAMQALIIVVLIFAFMTVLFQLFEPLLTKMIPTMMLMLLLVFIVQMIDLTAGIFGGSLYQFDSDMGLFISIALVIFASFSYVIDFRNVSQITRSEAPKEYEYYAALGLLITTIWLYVEVLRLLMIFANRDD